MILGWSQHQARDLHEPSRYLLDETVWKQVGSTHQLITRDPIPELLLGNRQRFQSTVARLPFQRTYRVATLTWAPDELDWRAFNRGDPGLRTQVASVIEALDRFFHSGIPEEARLPFLAGTHTHAGQLEVNIAMPRGFWSGQGKLRSFNSHPPTKGSERDLDAACDFLIHHFGFADPRCPSRKVRIKGQDWAEKRVAEARRARKEFAADQPVPFLLDHMKNMADNCDNIEDLLAAVRPQLQDTDFEVLNRTATTLRLGRPEAGPRGGLTLSGTLIADQEPTAEAIARRAAELRDAPRRLSAAWAKRALYNSRTYADGAWDEPEPDWQC
ncbi:MAG: hypothetical protein ACU0CO_09250, partial [Shimia sp.]